MFKQFDIDYDKLTIDGIEIKKPSYLSASAWFKVWEVFDGELVEQKVKTAFDKGYDCRGSEQDKEIDSVKNFCFKKLEHVEKKINDILDFGGSEYQEELNELIVYLDEARSEIWDS